MSETRRPKGLLLSLAYAAFISLGLPDGLLGVGWPSIRAEFGLPVHAVGALWISFTIGYLVSTSYSGQVLSRIGVGMLLVLSCAATATALLVFGLAPRWWVMVAIGPLSGLGAGAIDAALNSYAANNFDARTVNWLHAAFGIGAATGPLIMTSALTIRQSWRLGFLAVASMQIPLAICFASTRQRWETEARVTGGGEDRFATIGATLRLPVAWLSIALFFVYTGVEITAGLWMYSLLTEARHVPVNIAGLGVSVYWGCLTAGRILFGFLANRLALDRALLVFMLCVVISATLVWSNLTVWLSFLGFALMGLCLAPIFPSLLSTTPKRLSPAHVANVVGFQVGAAALGASLSPAAVGVAARYFGLEVLGPALFSGALGMIALFASLAFCQGSRPPAAKLGFFDCRPEKV